MMVTKNWEPPWPSCLLSVSTEVEYEYRLLVDGAVLGVTTGWVVMLPYAPNVRVTITVPDVDGCKVKLGGDRSRWQVEATGRGDHVESWNHKEWVKLSLIIPERRLQYYWGSTSQREQVWYCRVFLNWNRECTRVCIINKRDSVATNNTTGWGIETNLSR